MPLDFDDLHPGAAVALALPRMDELDVAKAIAAGELTSPQKYANGWLFALRVTGTGTSYRSQLKEYVWRDPNLYMNEHFRERCYGLPVIIEHPDALMLNSEEYRKRNVGMVVYPYLKKEDNEVWGIARILDQPTAQYMRDHDLSTSPAVVFKESDGNVKEKLSDGQHLLIEGKPSLLDHLAICEEGVWDKGGPPAGVTVASGTSKSNEEDIMADTEKTKREEELESELDALRKDMARKDADQGETLDKLLSELDAANKRMDAMEARKGDAEEDSERDERQAEELKKLAEEEEEEAKEAEEADVEDDSKRDAARKRYADAKKRFDEAHARLADAHGRMDAAGRARHDSARKRLDSAGKRFDTKRPDDEDEDEEKKKMPWEEAERKEGESDSSYSKRIDAAGRKFGDNRFAKRDDESTAAHCDRVADSARRDRARHDAEEKIKGLEKEAAEAKADAAAARGLAQTLSSKIDDLAKQMGDRPHDEEAVFADVQARADGVYMALGNRAPSPMRGETLVSYRGRLLRGIQKHSTAWKDVDIARLARMDSDAFKAAEVAIYADANTASQRPDVHGGSGLRKIIREREGGGHITEWAGDPREWMQDFMSDARAVTNLGRH